MIEERLVKECFEKQFGTDRCAIFTAPGRINLIGEHTDYNNGFVLPASIDKCITVAIRTNQTTTVKVYSMDYDESVIFDINGEKPAQQWACYIYGVVQEMKKRRAPVGGFNAVFGGDIPLGAGMSSSAALESVFGLALNDKFELWFSRRDLAQIGQMTEHNYVGVRCGIMDQFASLCGQAGKVIKLDCQSLEYEYFPFNPEGIKLVLIDTMVKHSLASSEYNVRRSQCEAGVAVVASHKKKIESLRDITMPLLNKYKDEMDPVVYKRCAFVINENQRLIEGCAALDKGNYKLFGKKMYATHEGLSKEYEVSCKELDFIVKIAKTHKDVLGARMMGGGFGGCVLSMVEDKAYDSYIDDVKQQYKKEFNIDPRVIDVVISDGAKKWLAKKEIAD
ncbi:MAG: galactokinase [Bacteroidales bacterium]|nr:galactokinase [Bacteroidales bacterium]MDD3200639.1 galactokinase [Bacteroidales bacterium]